MEEKKSDLVKKIAIILGICVIGIFGVIQILNLNSEGDPHFLFTEVPKNVTANNSVIHLEDKDIMNIRGVDVHQTNGKISIIYFRYSQTTPGISDKEFNYKYGSEYGNQTPKRYLEYKGVYYYALELIP